MSTHEIKNRRSGGSTSPPSAIQQTVREMPWYQRFIVKAIGLGMLGGPVWVGIQIVPHLIHEDTSWILALVILAFLSVVMFIGLLITIPKAATFVASQIPLPEKWRRLTEQLPERRGSAPRT